MFSGAAVCGFPSPRPFDFFGFTGFADLTPVLALRLPLTPMLTFRSPLREVLRGRWRFSTWLSCTSTSAPGQRRNYERRRHKSRASPAVHITNPIR